MASVRRRIVSRFQRHVGAKNDAELQGATVTADFLKGLAKGTGLAQHDIDEVVAEFDLHVGPAPLLAPQDAERPSPPPADEGNPRKFLTLAVTAFALLAVLVYAASLLTDQDLADRPSQSARSASSERRPTLEAVKELCIAEVLAEEKSVVDRCQTQDCVTAEVRILTNACYRKYGY